MNTNDMLQNFYEKFKTFKTKDNTFDFDIDNTNFDFTAWIDELRDGLFDDDGKLGKEIVELTADTPYVEFQYAWKYINKIINLESDHFNWTDTVYPTENSFYVLQNLSTFIFSLLNRLTMIRHILKNEDYLVDLTTKLTTSGAKSTEVGEQIRDKLKRVTFNNWRYNPLIKEYENSFLWDKYLKEARNVNEHYGVLFKTGDPSKFEETPFSFYAEIVLECYIFLFYLKLYVLKFKRAELIDKKDF